jgi:Domain of unknown function (DUF4357)
MIEENEATNYGRAVQLFTTPAGITIADTLNWTGHILVASRSKLKAVLDRKETGRTGIYFLVGDDPDQPSKLKVYIGEGDAVCERMKIHVVDPTKEFWTRVCIVTSKDSNLTKSHVRYLERRFVELTKAAGRANLANVNEPAKKLLPECDIADMEFFIEQVRLILPIVGFDFLRSKATSATATTNSTQLGKFTCEPVELVMRLVTKSQSHKYEAHAIESDGEFTVLAGSKATVETFSANSSFSQNSYAALREQLIKDGRLKQVEGQPVLEFSENVSFSSPSAAASIIANRSSNGRIEWKLVSTGQTFKEWQDSQVPVSESEGIQEQKVSGE